MLRDFYVILPSSVICPEFPNNTSSKYSTLLPSQLELGDFDWEVALVEITYPHTWFNINTSQTIRIQTSERRLEEATIRPGFFSSTEELIKTVNFHLTTKSMTKFYYQSLYNNIRVHVKRGENLILPRTLANILGFGNQNAILTSHDTPVIDPHPIESAFEDISPSDTNVESLTGVDLNANTHNIFIYSDIIKHVVVGNTYAPLLRILATNEQDHGRYVTKEFIVRNYVPLSSNYVKQISIDLRDGQGQNIQFTSGKVTVVLHFRMRK